MAVSRPARAWAAELVECWLAQQPHDDVLEKVPEWQRALVLKMASLSCQIINDYARRAARTGLMAGVPRSLRAAVDRRIKAVSISKAR